MATSTNKPKPPATPKAIGLHIGLNAVSGDAYAGWTGPLSACEFDANDMAAISRDRSFKASVLLTRQASRANVLAGLRTAAKALSPGDLFFLSYSGHGGQVPDANGDEPDGQDETWCLYDGQLIDDELYAELAGFAAGVRILVLSDSCHSGSVTRAAPSLIPAASASPTQRPKLMPAAVAMRVYRDHQAFYDKLQRDVATAFGRPVVPDPDTALAQVAASPRLTAIAGKMRAAVVLISGCQDNQISMDGDHNGAFTEQLLKVWNHGAYAGNIGRFHARIKAAMPPTQTPNLFTLGKAGVFLSQRPFALV